MFRPQPVIKERLALLAIQFTSLNLDNHHLREFQINTFFQLKNRELGLYLKRTKTKLVCLHKPTWCPSRQIMNCFFFHVLVIPKKKRRAVVC